MIEMKVSFDTDRARALQDTKHWAALALTPEEKVSVEDPVEMQKLADLTASVERAAKRWIVSTDPDEHVERIKAYADLGFRHLVFHAPRTPDQERFPASLWASRSRAAATRRIRLSHEDTRRATDAGAVRRPRHPAVAAVGDDLGIASSWRRSARRVWGLRAGSTATSSWWPRKAVSKAQGRYVDLATYQAVVACPAEPAVAEVNKDPRLVEGHPFELWFHPHRAHKSSRTC